MREGAPKIFADEGMNGFYKGLVPLWCRQIPYTMMKFACFEKTVEALYQYVVPIPRDECTKSQQLVSGGSFFSKIQRLFDAKLTNHITFTNLILIDK